MRIIPVVDVKDGLVVRAIAGRRDDYRPIASPLAASAAPADVVAGYLRLYPFETLYIADLNAIMRRGDNFPAMHSLACAFPSLRFWFDAGDAPPPGGAFDRVVGSESLSSAAAPPDFSGEADMILSLDFREREFLGPPGLLVSPQLWPRQVIVMTLARVGLNEGPDLDAFAAIKAQAGSCEVFAAGGVRGAMDLAALKQAGAAGALIASALHDGRLGVGDFEWFG